MLKNWVWIIFWLGNFGLATAQRDTTKLSTFSTENLSTVGNNSFSPSSLLKQKNEWKPSPSRATLLAVALPGAGQMYNRRYWKVPIVYTGFAVLGYFIVQNNNEYVKYRDAYILRYKGDKTPASYYDKYKDIKTLSLIREFYRRNRDFTVILTGAWYAITVLDAAVDAHLYSFNVTDDISATIAPKAEITGPTGQFSAGLGLTLTLK